MNRADRRRVKLGRTGPTVIAMPTLGKRTRIRKVTELLKENCGKFSIDNGMPNDSKWVVRLMQEHFERTGNPPITLDPSAPLIVARHRITNQPLAMLSCKPIPPGKIYVENLLVEHGRMGKIAGRALIERLMEMAIKKVCVVEASNVAMLRILEHYGGRVVGFVVEGPFTGATEAPAAAELTEQQA